MTIHTQNFQPLLSNAAYTDEFGVPCFGNTRDEALNNLADELAARSQVGAEKGSEPAVVKQTVAGELARERKSNV